MQILKNYLLIACFVLTACVTPEERAQKAEQQRIGVEKIKSQIPLLASVYAKACGEYIMEERGERFDKVVELMAADGFELLSTTVVNRGVRTRAISNPDLGIQVQMDVKAHVKYRCVVLPERPDTKLDSDSRKTLRNLAQSHVREFGGQFAESLDKTLRRPLDGVHHYIGFPLAPNYLFGSPREADPVGMLAARVVQTDAQ